MQDLSVDKSESINISELAAPYLRRWYWFVLGVMAMLILAYLYFKRQPPVYEMVSTVLIKDSKKTPSIPAAGFGGLGDLSSLGSLSSAGVENEIEIFRTKRLMNSVVKELGLQSEQFIEETFQKKELYGEKAPYLIKIVNERFDVNLPLQSSGLLIIEKSAGNKLLLKDANEKTTAIALGRMIRLPQVDFIILPNPNFVGTAPTSLELTVYSTKNRVEAYQNQLTVGLQNEDATVIRLALAHPNRDKGKDIVNKLVEVYNREAIADKNTESQETAKFIDGRIRKVGEDLGNVESNKERFKSANNIVDLETEGRLGLEATSQARSKALEVENQLELTNTLMGMVGGNNYQIIPNNVGLTNAGAIANISAYNQLVLERNRLLENATPQNPVVVEVTKQLNALRPSIIKNLQSSRDGLAQAKANFQQEQNKIVGRISKIPSQERLFREIEREQEIKENLYLLLLQKREEIQVTLAAVTPKARVLDFAYVSSQIAPKPLFIFSIALMIGLLLPFAVIYLRELFNNKVKTKHDVEKLSAGIPVIGEIPQLPRGAEEVIKPNDLTPMAEAFRILITNLKFILPKREGGRVVFTTSTVKGEGKTFVSVNLALTMATPSTKVIIIGSDIRNPQLQRFNPARRGLAGLTEFLYDSNTQLGAIIHQSTFNPNLDVIYSGMIPPNPTELLSNGRFAVLLEELRHRYDYIIVDTAPIMLVTDTILISDLADATLYVTRSGYSEKALIDYAKGQVRDGKLVNASFVLNDVDKDYFGYGNKYGYGYGTEKKGFFSRIFKR